MEAGEPQPKSIEQTKEILPDLPFIYQREQKPEEAQYREWRVSPVVFEVKITHQEQTKKLLNL